MNWQVFVAGLVAAFGVVGHFTIGTKTFTGAKLTLSEYSVANTDTLTQWYMIAENLPDTARPEIGAEMTASDLNSRVDLKGTLNRDESGLPIGGSAPLYVGYKALRKDVSADTTTPELLVFNTADEVEELIGPVSPENPLAFPSVS